MLGMGDVHHVGMKNHVKMEIGNGPETEGFLAKNFGFKGLEHEINYNYGLDQDKGAFLKFETLNKDGTWYKPVMKQLSGFYNLGNHSFAVDSKWNQGKGDENDSNGKVLG